MPRHTPSSMRGLSSLELPLLIILMAVFVAVAAEKIWELRIASEKTAVEVMVGNMRGALGAEVARLVAQGRVEEIPRHDGGNPMSVMGTTPLAYRGALHGANPAEIPGYSWYFDRDEGLLVYRVANADNFETPLSGPARILFRLHLSYHDADGDGRYQHGVDSIEGLDIISLHPYRWRFGDDEGEE